MRRRPPPRTPARCCSRSSGVSGTGRADPDRSLAEGVEERSDGERAASGPEAKIVNWPAAAGSLLPDTGASTRATSGRSASAMAATRSNPATPIVLICTQIEPGASAASTPWSRAIEMTASASVTIVTMMAARRAASAAESATSAPSPARSRVASGSRFQTIVGRPARSALVAIPWPIAAMPRMATGSWISVIERLPSSGVAGLRVRAVTGRTSGAARGRRAPWSAGRRSRCRSSPPHESRSPR